ncbi:response regulator [Dyadobacter sandarakinus]|uniref:histidine kinase n=1 Tax=Dyadobacter sandarakinus TaxID=2747268 RepID=A0ABX7I7B5_9BACT|nr:response regulator [Dyadobacter sandarakinus]QRR01997.1 response regulator [Dyadobacter sandarakinus]
MDPIPTNEIDRLNALLGYQILDTEADIEFDRLTQLASIVCNAPISLVSLIDQNRQWLKSQVGMDIREAPRDVAFCGYTILNDKLFEIEDAAADVRFSQNPYVTGDSKIRFYAGHPLTDPDGLNLGTLCVLDRVPRKLSESQRMALKLISASVVDLIVNRRKKQETEHFEKVFTLSNDLICIAGKDRELKKVNPAFEKVLGWDKSYLLSTSFFDLVHPEDLAETEQEIRKLTAGAPVINFSHRFRCSDGGYKMLQWVATPEPETGFLFAIARDISEERKKELMLHSSEQRFRSFFENSQGLICTHSLSGNFLAINKAGAASLGYTQEEVLALTIFDIVPAHYHDQLNKYLETIAEAGQSSGLMPTVRKAGGELTWLYSNVLEKNAEGDFYVIVNAIDITERHSLEKDLKQTKQMLERTNKVARIGAWELDLFTENVFWSDVTKSIHGVTPDFVPDYATALLFYTDESRERLSAAVARTVELGEPYDLELQIMTPAERLLWVRVIGAAEFEEGRCVRLYGTFQDITESCRQRDELNAARQRAEQASISKSEFLANMSHEIRTPLNGVIGFTDLMMKTPLNSVQNQYLSVVNQSANALLSIINDILDFSKIEAGKLELDVEKCDLYQACTEAVDILTYQAQKKGLEMLLNYSGTLPRFIWADAVRLKQILVNLLGNAVKFTEKGEIELKVSALSDTTGPYVDFLFEVWDTGIGIKEDKQGKIFEAFSQEDISTTKKYGGTGLGLTITNKLLGMMGSSLQLKSKPGEGSCFYFEIQLKAEQGEAVKYSKVGEVKKVLIVDDNENHRLILKNNLLLKNILVEEAGNGFEALQLLAKQHQFDVILMDYHMPYMDGLECIRKIRENFSNNPLELPIVLLHSTSDDERIIRASEELSINSRLVKPIKTQDLFDCLHRISLQQAEVTQPRALHHFVMDTTDITVLVVDDNPINMLLARTILNRILPNAEVLEAANGEEALAVYRNADIILMDVQMPVLNGYEATEKIRSMEKDFHVPIIALTAGNVKGEKERCLASGMDDFVTKPFVEESLVQIFRLWLNPASGQQKTPVLEEKKPLEAHLDLQVLTNMLGDDEKMLNKVLSVTITELKSSLNGIQQQVRERNLESLKTSGHKLNGTAMTAGLHMLSQLAWEFEHMDSIDESRIMDLTQALEAEIGLVLGLIEDTLVD